MSRIEWAIVGVIMLGIVGVQTIRHYADRIDGIEVESPTIQAEPECDRLGPYPYSGGLDMYIEICPKGAEL